MARDLAHGLTRGMAGCGYGRCRCERRGMREKVLRFDEEAAASEAGAAAAGEGCVARRASCGGKRGGDLCRCGRVRRGQMGVWGQDKRCESVPGRGERVLAWHLESRTPAKEGCLLFETMSRADRRADRPPGRIAPQRRALTFSNIGQGSKEGSSPITAFFGVLQILILSYSRCYSRRTSGCTSSTSRCTDKHKGLSGALR